MYSRISWTLIDYKLVHQTESRFTALLKMDGTKCQLLPSSNMSSVAKDRCLLLSMLVLNAIFTIYTNCQRFQFNSPSEKLILPNRFQVLKDFNSFIYTSVFIFPVAQNNSEMWEHYYLGFGPRCGNILMGQHKF